MLVIVGLPVFALLLYAVFPHINEWSFAEPFSALLPNLADSSLIDAALHSLNLSFSVTLLSIVLAMPLAYWRSSLPARSGKLWDVLFLVPFLIPPYIGSLAWMQLLQINGFVEQLFGFNLAGFLYSFPGMVTVMALHLFPMMYFALANAFRLIGSRYGDVARVFGGRPWPIFMRIYLPMLTPALLSSGLIIFVLTIEEFGTPEFLGSRFGFEVIVTAIHAKFSDWPIDLPGAAVLSLILIFIAFVAYHLHHHISERFSSSLDQPSMTDPGVQPGWIRLALIQGLFAITFAVAVLMPISAIALTAFMDTLSGGLAADNFSTDNIIELFTRGGEAWGALTTSLTLALLAALSTVVISVLVAFTTVRLRSRGIQLLDFLSILPNAIPGMAIAVGLILAWNQRFWPVTPYNTSMILLIAYVCLTLPYPIRMVTAALRQMPKSLDDAAYIFGAGEMILIWRILAPLLFPIALAAGFIVFAITTRELVSSLMLAPPGVETVATYVFHQFDQGSVNAGMAMSLITILVSGSIIAIGQNLQKNHSL
jgi:iron(III) transport system permease protein